MTLCDTPITMWIILALACIAFVVGLIVGTNVPIIDDEDNGNEK